MDRDHDDERPVEVNTSVATVVIVDNVPKTEMKRYDKLQTVIRKTFSAYGTIIEDGLFIPTAGDPPMTCGYAFIEYETAEMATRAVVEGNGKRLDNAHTLLVNHYEDFDKYSSVPPTFQKPLKSDYESKVNLNSWLLDESGRDMFVIRAGVDTQVYYNDPVKKAQEYCRTYKYGGEREKAQDKHWTDLYVAWSPKGSYLATFHEPGIVVWGGENFEKLGRFPHSHVCNIEFSPNERYLITSNNMDKQEKQTGEQHAYIVWDVRQQKKIRGFEKEKEDNTLSWPMFKWSHDDKYVAKKSADIISVYETPSMVLLDKKAIKLPGIADFAWSPARNFLAYWIPAKDNGPATVAIIELPSRQVVREKHLYNVVDVKLHWHEQGEYLAVKVSRRKTKKTLTTNFEIFHINAKDIPIETVELEGGIVAFAWEPHGHRFAVIQGDGTKNNIHVYDVKGGKKVKHLKTYENRPANALFWSPAGGFLVLAGFGTLNGQLEWLDVEAGESLVQTEHFQCSELEWDPSGRYVITSATQPLGDNNWRYTMDNGYNLWSVQGQLLATVKIDQCYQVLWRPRPQNLLSKEQMAELKKGLKEKYWKTFESEDNAIRQSQLTGIAKERLELKAKWKEYRANKEKEYADEREGRRALRRGYASDDEDDFVSVETVVEEEVGREEELWQ